MRRSISVLFSSDLSFRKIIGQQKGLALLKRRNDSALPLSCGSPRLGNRCKRRRPNKIECIPHFHGAFSLRLRRPDLYFRGPFAATIAPVLPADSSQRHASRRHRPIRKGGRAARLSAADFRPFAGKECSPASLIEDAKRQGRTTQPYEFPVRFALLCPIRKHTALAVYQCGVITSGIYCNRYPPPASYRTLIRSNCVSISRP